MKEGCWVGGVLVVAPSCQGAASLGGKVCQVCLRLSRDDLGLLGVVELISEARHVRHGAQIIARRPTAQAAHVPDILENSAETIFLLDAPNRAKLGWDQLRTFVKWQDLLCPQHLLGGKPTNSVPLCATT